jgi:quercetin dioxygenase-like cupin family protein
VRGAVRLPIDFDVEALCRDLARIRDEQWTPHFNRGDYEGEWSGVALRGPAGAGHPILALTAHPGTKQWADTPLLERCTYFRHVLARFQCPLQSVRLLRLAPGAVIREHRDPELGLEDGEARLHVPIATSPEVEFLLDGVRIPLRAGETWYLDVRRPHAVTNRSGEHRVHLVADCAVNPWLASLIGAA